MNNYVIIVDDDSHRLNKVKATLEKDSIYILKSDNLYDLISKIYKYNVTKLIFNPNLSWINSVDFVLELQKKYTENIYTVFFLYDNIDKEAFEKIRKINIIPIVYPNDIQSIINYL